MNPSLFGSTSPTRRKNIKRERKNIRLNERWVGEGQRRGKGNCQRGRTWRKSQVPKLLCRYCVVHRGTPEPGFFLFHLWIIRSSGMMQGVPLSLFLLYPLYVYSITLLFHRDTFSQSLTFRTPNSERSKNCPSNGSSGTSVSAHEMEGVLHQSMS